VNEQDFMNRRASFITNARMRTNKIETWTARFTPVDSRDGNTFMTGPKPPE